MNVLVLGARAPIAADLARALALGGHQVWAADSFRAPVGAASPYVRGCVRLPAPRADFAGFRARLAQVCREIPIDAIVPVSEEVFWLAGAAASLPQNVDVRASARDTLAQVHQKGAFARLAVRLGYGAPENHEVCSAVDLARLGDPRRFVIKPVYSRFASRVLIRPSAREVSRVRPTPQQPWLAQTFVAGRELCSYNVADSAVLSLCAL